MEAADFPDDNTKGDWVIFGLNQTAALDKANGRQQDTLSIVEQCDAINRK